MVYQPDSDLLRIWVEELSRADCWILGFGYLRNGSSNTGLVAGSASPGLKIWERRGTSDGIQILKKRFTRLKNLKAEVAEIEFSWRPI